MVDNLINMQTINILAPYIDYLPEFLPIKFNISTKVFRGGSRGRVQGVRTPPWDDLRCSNTTGILQKKKLCGLIGVEVEQEMSAPPPKKNPGSAPVLGYHYHNLIGDASSMVTRDN